MTRRAFVRWALLLMMLLPWLLIVGALITLVWTIFGIVTCPVERP